MQWQGLEQIIKDYVGAQFAIEKARGVGGGCINSCWAIEGKGERFFVKLNQPAMLAMFEAEKEGLQALADTNTVKVPHPVGCGKTGDYACLILEYLPLVPITEEGQRMLGEQLATLHAIEQRCFGWEGDNWIGATLQRNPKSNDWAAFWRENRLASQLGLAEKNGFGGRLQKLGARLLTQMNRLFTDYRPAPSLLHGDLWSGNAAMTEAGVPVIFDPACYWGDREADLAMTDLFGGFGRDFYQAYESILPLEAGYSIRKGFYNLYHILNHLNLFGSGYLRQAETMMEKLLSQIR